MGLSGAIETTRGYELCFRVIALYTERSGQHQTRRAYVWATSLEKAQRKALKTFKGAKHVVVKVRH